MSIEVTIKLNDKPLKRVWVSHYDFWRVSNQTIHRITNDSGKVTIPGVNGNIKLRVHAQNSVVKILDGEQILPLEISHEFSVSNGSTININTTSEKVKHFEVMNECLKVYDSIFRKVAPFNKRGRRAFPFGLKDSYTDSKNMLPRLELVYPDNSLSNVSWVEPASIATSYPLIHLKGGASINTIAHEMAHALYFSILPFSVRSSVEIRYLSYITERVMGGHNPGHFTGAVTSQFVAWIEAFGILSSKLYKVKRDNPSFSWSALEAEFIRREKESVFIENNGVLEPKYKGDDVEGAIYGAIFVDLAERIGLKKSIEFYINSGDDNILEFDDFRNMLIIDTSYDDDVIAVSNAWEL